MLDAKYRVRVKREPMPSIDRGGHVKKPWLKWSIYIGAGLLLILIVLLIIGSVGRRTGPEPTSETVDLKISIERGNAQIKHQDSETFEDAVDQAALIVGDSVRTEEEALVTLESSKKSMIRLDEKSRIEITQLDASGVAVNLVDGQAWVNIANSDGLPVSIATAKTKTTASGTIFDVEYANRQVSMRSINDDVSLAVSNTTASAEDNATESQDSSLSYLLKEGKQITIDERDLPKEQADFDSQDIDQEFQESFWYRWNAEKDDEFANKLLGRKDQNAPSLSISEPEDGSTVDQDSVTVKGTTDISATIEINDKKVDNDLGDFSKEIDLKEGENTITIVVTDPAGNQTKKELTIKRKAVAPGSVSFSVSVPTAGQANLSWSQSDAKDFLQYSIKKNQALLKSIGDIYTTTFTDTGLSGGSNYTYQLCVVDTDQNETCSAEQTITAKNEVNQKPTVVISEPAGGASIAAGSPVTFKASGNDPEGTVLTYTWDFGDGVSTTGQNISHTFAVVATPTDYVVTVFVRDSAGASGQASITLTITP